MRPSTVHEIVAAKKPLEERKADLLSWIAELDPNDKSHHHILVSMLNTAGTSEPAAEKMGFLDLIPVHANPRAPRSKRLPSFTPSVPCMTPGQAMQAIDFLKRTIPEITAFTADKRVLTLLSSGPKSP